MNVVERVARAIYAADFGNRDEPMPNGVRETYLWRAREAIKAMREPTDAMISAPQERGAVIITKDGHQSLFPGNARQAWRIMIDEALGVSDLSAPWRAARSPTERSTMREWPKFISHKVVSAAPIVDIVDAGGELSLLVKPYGDHTIERFVTTEPAMMARAEVGWFAVRYANGFKSVSPGDVFRDGYVLLEE